jgi:hypothetical protein
MNETIGSKREPLVLTNSGDNPINDNHKRENATITNPSTIASPSTSTTTSISDAQIARFVFLISMSENRFLFSMAKAEANRLKYPDPNPLPEPLYSWRAHLKSLWLDKESGLHAGQKFVWFIRHNCSIFNAEQNSQ